MSATPFATLRSHLNGTPMAKWTAILTSVFASVALVALLPVCYLFIDHLVWKGRIPRYAELSPRQQQRFQEEWNTLGSQEEMTAALNLVRPEKQEPYVSDLDRWEWRWRAATWELLRTRISESAAEAYLSPRNAEIESGPGAVGKVLPHRLGVASLIARERSHWTAKPLAGIARTCPWMWRPGNSGQANTAYLTGLFVIALAIAIAQLLASLWGAYAATLASIDAVGRIRRAIFSHTNRLGILVTRPQSIQEVTSLFIDKAGTLEDGFRAWMTGLWQAPLAMLIFVAVIVAINPPLGVSFLILGMLVWLVGGQLASWFRRDSRHAARRSEARRLQMRESLSMLQLVKSYLMDRFNQNRIERQLADYARAEWRRLRGNALSGPALTAASLIAGVIMLYLGGRSILGGDSSLAGVTVQILAVAAMVAPVRTWVSTRIRLRRAKAAAADISEFLDRRADAGQPIDAEFLHPMKKKLEFVDVSYREPGTGRMILDHVTLSIPTGTRVAVIGADRAETHTFAYLLSRFLDPTAGEIRIDAKNLRWVTHESLRTQVAMVMQQALIFNDTVANNIGCGDAGFSLPQIIEAAKVAHAHQFVQRLPYGYETMIGDSGHSLTPGEKLRIALARAILRDPSLIVVEEPDGPIDSDTKALLDDTFERLRNGRTLMVLSRRQSVLRSADQIFVINNGRLAASGSHAELMQTSELYRNLLFQEIAVAGVTA